MALGDSYATVAELRTRLDVTGTAYDSRLTEALSTASRNIEAVCGRQFNQDTSASARVYYPESACMVRVEDIYTTTSLAIATDGGDDGTYETTWAAADYQLEPVNGIVSGQTGWPYYVVRAVRGLTFPTSSYRAPVQVTARWGWSAVPAPIKEACLIIAAETFKIKDAPFGVAGFGDFGPVRIRTNPVVMAMLAPYRRDAVLVA